jgi:hypothetical protein
LLNPRLPFIRSSYYPPSLVEKYASSSYRSYKAGGLVGYAAATDPTQSASFTLNTSIKVAKGDLIVTFQWSGSDDNLGNTFAPSDNLISAYTELGGGDIYLGGGYVCGTTGFNEGLGGAYYAVAPAAGQLSVSYNWAYPPTELPAYAVYVFHGQTFNGNIYFPNGGSITATGPSASITTSGLSSTTYHYALLVAYVSNNPCLNAVPSLQAQGFKQALTWGDTCYQVCHPAVATLSDALFYGYKYSVQDFTFNLQFTFQGTTIYGYAIALV